MRELKYVSIDRIFVKMGRDLSGTELNESDVIEWIGEALDFLLVPQVLVEDVVFLNVVDYHAEVPSNLHMITQIARNNDWVPTTCIKAEITPEAEEVASEPCECAECQAEAIDLGDWSYTIWTSSPNYLRNYTPVRLATGTFFNSLVCEEKDKSLYETCSDEYTVVGSVDKKFRFNFIEGQVAVSYLKNSVDETTGYPLIPDQISYITAITYYIKWKIAEMYAWSGRDGWEGKADKAEVRWLKYVRQAKNFMKMPKTLDEYQNLLEQTHYLIPNHKKYYGFFGDLGKSKIRNFNNLNKY